MAPLPHRVSVPVWEEPCVYDLVWCGLPEPKICDLHHLVIGRYWWINRAIALYQENYREIGHHESVEQDLSLGELTTFVALFERLSEPVARRFGIVNWGDPSDFEYPGLNDDADPEVADHFAKMLWPNRSPTNVAAQIGTGRLDVAS